MNPTNYLQSYCCLAYNYNDDYSAEQLLEECQDFFYHERLQWCGCGLPSLAKKAIRDYLRCVNCEYYEKHNRLKQRFGVEYVDDNELLLCLAYALDSAGFTEHGGSIGGAWLTPEGKMFLWLLEQNEEILE